MSFLCNNKDKSETIGGYWGKKKALVCNLLFKHMYAQKIRPMFECSLSQETFVPCVVNNYVIMYIYTHNLLRLRECKNKAGESFCILLWCKNLQIQSVIFLLIHTACIHKPNNGISCVMAERQWQFISTYMYHI